MSSAGLDKMPAADVSTNTLAEVQPENWNWHVQNTDIVQGDPAFNRDRGPVSVFAARLHWEF